MNKIKKYIPPILAGIISLTIILIIMYLKHITPFGKKSFLAVDFLHQYAPMLKELFKRATTGKSLLYSFNMGLGLPIYRNFFNYLSSPFNIIMFIFNEHSIITSYSFIIAIKLAFSAVTMCLLLNKKFKNNYTMIALSILYSLSAYFMAYYWNIMWLDGLIFLPLVVLGLERLVDNNKPLLYIISLSIMMYANYFIGYMIAIFIVIYFISYLLMVDKKNKKKILLIFVISSALVGGLCALSLIPIFSSLKSISATKDSWPQSQYYVFTLKEFIFNHLSGVKTTVFSSGDTNAPNISLGIISIMLIPLFYFNKKINIKIKLAYFLPLAFLLLCFLIPQLDFIMQGFHVPNDLPYRYSFLYIFILTILCGYSLDKIKNINIFYIIGCFLLTLGFIILSKILNFNTLSDAMYLLNIIIIACYFAIILLYKYLKRLSFIAVSLLIVAVSIECILKYQDNWDITYNTSSIYTHYDEIGASLEYIKDNDNDYYRIEKPYIITFNDPDWFDYYGLTTFSSMSYEAESKLMNSLGAPGNEINSSYYKPNTPIFNMMFNIKYVFSHYPIKYYNLYEQSANYDTYKFDYPTSIIFSANKSLNNWQSVFTNPFENQNEFIQRATNSMPVLNNIEYIVDYTHYYEGDKTVIHYETYDNVKDYYLYFPKGDIDFIIINGTLYYMGSDYQYGYGIDVDVTDTVEYNENYILEVSDVSDIYIGYANYYEDAFYAYYVDEDALSEAYNYINSRLAQIEVFNEHYIKANLTSNEGEIVYTSIPYDKGWNVYVDGSKVKTKKLADTLLSFDVEPGDHVIELEYKVPFVMPSAIITIISIPLVYLFNKKIKKNN